jgi:hypothetical protein
MPKLKLSLVEDDKPVRLSIELSAKLHRDLVAYGKILGGDSPIEPVKLVAPMLDRFMATDRAFASAKREQPGS